MNRDSTLQNRASFGSREALALAIVLVPIAAVIALFCYGAIGQQVVSRQLVATVDQIADTGLPTTNHQMSVWYDDHTSDEHSLQWRNVIRAIDGLKLRFIDLSDTSSSERERVPAPNSDWDVEPIMRLYMGEARPILDAISELVDDDEAVWEPLIMVVGVTTLYRTDHSTIASNLIADEFRISVYSGDQDRAIRALNLMERFSRTLDAKSGGGWDSLVFRVLDQRRQLIRQTLGFEFWRESDLLTLDQMLASDNNVDARHKRTQDISRAMTFASIDSDFNYYRGAFGVRSVSPSEKLAALLRVPKSTVPPSAGIERLNRDLKKRKRLRDSPSPLTAITGLPTTSLSDFFRSYGGNVVYFNSDMMRRWTRTAVGIKRYLTVEGEFPDDLSDLGSLGIPNSELLADGATRFGYEVDGQRAILWTRYTSTVTADLREVIAPQPPSQSGRLDELINVEVIIR